MCKTCETHQHYMLTKSFMHVFQVIDHAWLSYGTCGKEVQASTRGTIFQETCCPNNLPVYGFHLIIIIFKTI